jgi:hypothetical protein
MSSLLASLVPHTPVWLVVPMHLLIKLLCHLSLTHHSTPGQECIGLHHMTTSHQMISGLQGLKPLRTPSSSLFDDCWQRGRRTGLKPQDSFWRSKEQKRLSRVSLVSVRLVIFSLPICLFHVGQTGLYNRSDQSNVWSVIQNFGLCLLLWTWGKHCNVCYWMF